jgi:hypothetical protein
MKFKKSGTSERVERQNGMRVTISQVKPGKCIHCPHCQSDEDEIEFLRERQRLADVLVQEAKDFFGSEFRNDVSRVITATGDLLVFENGLTK